MLNLEYENYLPEIFVEDGNFEKILKKIHEMIENRINYENSKEFSCAYLFTQMTFEKELAYIRDYYLPFMFEHGYILKETEPFDGITGFYSLKDTLKYYDLIKSGTPKEEVEPSTFKENLRFMEYMETAEFYPEFMKDFHAGKSICKRIADDVEFDSKEEEVLNWCDGFVYSGDFFLYFCALHGYTLQKIELPNRVFYDIDHTMKTWKERKDKRLESMENK